MATRRMVLMTGAALAGVSIAGAAGVAWAPGLSRARAPWRQAGESFGDPRLDALAYAILAPNPHNRQPWRFALAEDSAVDIYCDLDRRLPETDPPDRQTTIGFGAMLELLRMAGAEKGYAVEISPFPDGAPAPRLDERRIARAVFNRDLAASRDPLFAETVARRTTRTDFDMEKPVTSKTLDSVRAAAQSIGAAGGTIHPERIDRLVDLCVRGWTVEFENGPTRRESIDLMRIGNREIVANPDGIALEGTAMGLAKMAGIVTAETLDDPETAAYRAGVSEYANHIRTARGFIWLTAAENTRFTQLDAGRDWVRMNLAAQALGLAVQPLSQVLQEFPAMADLYWETQQEVGVTPPGVVHMLGRIGYARFAPPTPRWPLASRLVDATA